MLLPDLTPEQREAMDEGIMRQLFRINTVAQTLFHAPLSPRELRRAHGRLRQGVLGVLAQSRDGMTPMQQPQVNPNLMRDSFLRSSSPIGPGTFIGPPGSSAAGQLFTHSMNREAMQPNVQKIPGRPFPVSEVF